MEVLGHASCHGSQEMQKALPQLRDEVIELYLLLAYSPELKDTEPYFGRVKHQEMPTRIYSSTPKRSRRFTPALDGSRRIY